MSPDSSPSRADRKRAANTALDRAKFDQKADAVVSRVIGAAKPELGSFVFLFWKDGDPSTNVATIHLQQMKPRSAVNLALLAAEHAVQEDIRLARPETPPAYLEAMRAFVADLHAAVQRCDSTIRSLKPIK